jgi:ABC-type transporter Mla MlaB component
VLRVMHRPDEFELVALDYCVTYEVSPPSWERAKCQARISGATVSTVSPSLSLVSDASSSFIESTLNEEPGRVQQSTVELSGQLVGDIGATLAKMDGQLGKADIVNVSCSRLIRVDFIAAGDLLNWVLQRRAENRIVSFTESHRLVALFFGAMGINEHAKVKVRTV